jgi:hypothetical protein
MEVGALLTSLIALKFGSVLGFSAWQIRQMNKS